MTEAEKAVVREVLDTMLNDPCLALRLLKISPAPRGSRFGNRAPAETAALNPGERRDTLAILADHQARTGGGG